MLATVSFAVVDLGLDEPGSEAGDEAAEAAADGAGTGLVLPGDGEGGRKDGTANDEAQDEEEPVERDANDVPDGRRDRSDSRGLLVRATAARPSVVANHSWT